MDWPLAIDWGSRVTLNQHRAHDYHETGDYHRDRQHSDRHHDQWNDQSWNVSEGEWCHVAHDKTQTKYLNQSIPVAYSGQF